MNRKAHFRCAVPSSSRLACSRTFRSRNACRRITRSASWATCLAGAMRTAGGRPLRVGAPAARVLAAGGLQRALADEVVGPQLVVPLVRRARRGRSDAESLHVLVQPGSPVRRADRAAVLRAHRAAGAHARLGERRALLGGQHAAGSVGLAQKLPAEGRQRRRRFPWAGRRQDALWQLRRTVYPDLYVRIGAHFRMSVSGRRATFSRMVNWMAMPVDLCGELGQLCRQ